MEIHFKITLSTISFSNQRQMSFAAMSICLQCDTSLIENRQTNERKLNRDIVYWVLMTYCWQAGEPYLRDRE